MSEPRHVACRVPETSVAPICEKGWRMAFRKLRGKFYDQRVSPDKPGGRVFPYVERIWFPYYLYTIGVNSRKGPGTIVVTVEAWSGAFAIFQLDEFLTTGAPPSGEEFSPKLTIDACEVTARENLLHTIMRQRSRSGGKPIPDQIVAREAILYPLWIYYYRRKKGVIDIKIVDGVSGQLVGHRTRSGVLEAFVAKQEAKSPAEGEGNATPSEEAPPPSS